MTAPDTPTPPPVSAQIRVSAADAHQLAEALADLREFVAYLDQWGVVGYAAADVAGVPITISLDVLRVLAANSALSAAVPAGPADEGGELAALVRSAATDARSVGAAVVAVERLVDGATPVEVAALARTLGVTPARGRAGTVERIVAEFRPVSPQQPAEAAGEGEGEDTEPPGRTRDSAPSELTVSTEDGQIVATVEQPEDDDVVAAARRALDEAGMPGGWYGLATAYGPTNPDHIDYVPEWLASPSPPLAVSTTTYACSRCGDLGEVLSPTTGGSTPCDCPAATGEPRPEPGATTPGAGYEAPSWLDDVDIDAEAPSPDGDRDAWRRRYAALIDQVDAWMTEHHGEDDRDSLVGSLGVRGWLQMGDGWHRVSSHWAAAPAEDGELARRIDDELTAAYESGGHGAAYNSTTQARRLAALASRVETPAGGGELVERIARAIETRAPDGSDAMTRRACAAEVRAFATPAPSPAPPGVDPEAVELTRHLSQTRTYRDAVARRDPATTEGDPR